MTAPRDGWAGRIRRWFGLRELDDAVERRLEAEHEAEVERAVHDPFRFASRRDFEAFRRKHGRRTRRRPERD